MKTVIQLGSRESRLALVQTELAAQALKDAFPEIHTRIVGRKTLGDKILDKPLLSFGGKGVFISEFEEALQSHEIDFAVHSTKDLPAVLGEGLGILAVLPGEDPRDVLVTRKKEGLLNQLSQGTIKQVSIGTSSLRRKLQMEILGEKLWPGTKVVCENLRGNVLTRLDRLDQGEFDGIILAAAGLKRLEIETLRPDQYEFYYFSTEEMIPAAGQGILAIEGYEGNPANEMARAICHQETWVRFLGERRVLEDLNAGCHEPIGVHCRLELTGWFHGTLTLEGILKRGEMVRRGKKKAAFSSWEEACQAVCRAADDLALLLEGKESTSPETAKGFVWLVGAGPGDPGLITVKGARLLKNCDCIVYDHLVDKGLLDVRREGCQLLFVGKEKGRHSMEQEEINRLLIAKAQEGKQVVRLKGGDPFVFGRGGEEALALNAAGIPWQVVPGVTSAVAALSAAGIPITHRRVSRSFHVITGHTRKDGGLPEEFYHLGSQGGTKVFLMGLSHLKEIADGLIAQGVDPMTPAAVIQEGTLPSQRTVRGKLKEIWEKTKAEGLKAPAVIVVGETAGIDLAPKNGSSGNLEGVRVGITGTAHLKEELTSLLEQQGARVKVLCSMEVVPVNQQECEESFRRLKEFTWLVFTSANGIRLYLECLQKLLKEGSGLDLRSFAHLKLGVVGRGTGEELRRHGLTWDYMPEIFNTRELARGLAAKLGPEDRVLIPRAVQGSKELGEVLSAAGISFQDLPIYDVRGKVEEAAGESVDVAVFASASGVRAFFEGGMELPEDTPVVCIGEACEKALKEYGREACVTAKEATVQGLVQAVVDLTGSRKRSK
ncbi:MAG TPA: uroporphyrinogen-III C-methyltransferase [Candidatus Cottocaccamicrobium excrementipullorum]|nr:uroporphyrinogen-III C-methyltransferase [Candidatus Cottocaccamicrobium excrementipullorum]